MECQNCHSTMTFLSGRQKVGNTEIEEVQYLCPQCGYNVVVNDGMQSWYDRNDKPVHASHDR